MTILQTEENKEFKICDVLGGLDVTRLVSNNARSFFAAAIEDVELVREFFTESLRHQSYVGPFPNLGEMSRSLDGKARGISDQNFTTVSAGLGYTDDRPDRRVDRYTSLAGGPLVGDRQSDFDMLDSLSPLFPWLLDRKSKEDFWWKDHLAGNSQGEKKEPFEFDALYTAVWAVSYAGTVLYYPPLAVYGHPLTMGDIVGSYYTPEGELYMEPTFPANNPTETALFTKPYPDTAVPGLSLISAVAPIYYTGTFQGHQYNHTYIGGTGVDIAVASVSSYLDVLQGSLTPSSFGILVDSQFSTIVISQDVVKKLYPERTGFEDLRVTYGVDGSIVQDRRNQTYLPSDTILQELTKLDNADWSGLLNSVQNVAPGERDVATIDITLTGDENSLEFYVMFERWHYVADWSLLVFAPKTEVEEAINVTLDTNLSSGETGEVSLTGERGTSLQAQGTIVNNGNLDVTLSTKNVPTWIKLDTAATDKVTLASGESLVVDFEVSTSELNVGSLSSAISFDVQDAEYPDCFFNEVLSIPVSVIVTAKDCGNKVADPQGICVCGSNTVDMFETCVGYSLLISCILFPLALVSAIVVYLRARHKRRAKDKMWEINPAELKFSEPPDVIGKGSFGIVLLGEYRGTQVAVKTLRDHQSPPRRTSRIDFASDDVKSVEGQDEECPTNDVRSDNHSIGSSSCNSIFGRRHKASTNDFVKEIRLLSKLRHPCIATILGAVKDKKNPMLIMEYMEQGSLYDLIHNETMDFEGQILLSMLQDISKGILFLHKTKPQIVHGDLKSHNILVDGRFRAKVTDFGLSFGQDEGSTAGTPFWTAPEVLRGEVGKNTTSDVFSFGIILYEIYSRKEPYQGEDFETVIEQICNPSMNKRPPVPSTIPPGVAAIMNDCLVEDAAGRPTFEEISNRFNRFTPQAVEPTNLIKKRKPGERNFDVLLKMFPRHIAEALRDGRKVEPEHHDCVTIFFSDIVGFTTISSELPPEKVSDMLHRLFGRFDSLSDQLQIHKMETIVSRIAFCIIF